MARMIFTGLLIIAVGSTAFSALPPPPAADQLADWSNPFDADAPGLAAADNLIDRPAAARGPIVVRDGHFYSGDKRVKFWGVNFAFGANFPTHTQADALAHRLARFGINAVRLHHMDNQPFPNGIFDQSLTKLSPEALDRLDYFTAALANSGIWSDINLHVSRNYAPFHVETRDKPGEAISKIVDLFDPVLIDAQKQYAHDLLTHVNAYTHHRYADEPAVAIVEINNENSLFMWDAKEKLASLSAPFDAELQRQWNQWLIHRYSNRDGLAKAWSVGAEPLGEQMLHDADFATLGNASPGYNEFHDGPQLSAHRAGDRVVLDVSHTDDTAWHVQFTQSNVTITAGRPYTVSFRAHADKPVTIDVSVGQAHAPWENLGLATPVKLTTKDRPFTLTFVGKADDTHGRLSFALGHADAAITLSKPMLAPGGIEGLGAKEDPATATVAMPGLAESGTKIRTADWYTFLEETEARYYSGLYGYLHHDLGVKCPITGTIAFGLLPLKAQLGMDFIDAHAYWQHPQFPHKSWSNSDWKITNTPMVDAPEKNELFALAAYRVAGKPFTCTEYNHPAPSDWQAECIPMIASYAAAQDWDGVFMFAYSHGNEFDKPITQDFFNIEGNPLKMPLMPIGARLFLGNGMGPLPAAAPTVVNPDPAAGASQIRVDMGSLSTQVSARYPDQAPPAQLVAASSTRLSWKPGQFTAHDDHAAVFVGFDNHALPMDLGEMSIQSLTTPFATIVLTSADNNPIKNAEHLLLSTVARAQNTGMQWNADRTSVSTFWGHAPEQIEKVSATILINGHWSKAFALDPAGKPTGSNLATVAGEKTELRIGEVAAQIYAIDR